MGFFAGLNAEKYDRQYTDRQLTERIVEYLQPHRRRLGWIAGLAIVLGIFGAALPVAVGLIVDSLADQPTLENISMVGVALVFLAFALWGLNWARRSLTVRVIGDVVLDLRARAVRAAAEHDLSFYDQFSSGRIVSRITSDTNDFGQLVVIITDVLSQLISAVILYIVLWRVEWRMAVLFLVFLPIIYLVTMGFRNLARRVSRSGMRALADVNAAMSPAFSTSSTMPTARPTTSTSGAGSCSRWSSRWSMR
jgi:ATP-binding cassette subfamily B protein